MRAACFLLLVLWGGSAWAERPPAIMIELTLDGRKIEGMPVAASPQRVHLLGRDGRLWDFAPAAASSSRQTAARFRPYSPSELRAALLREMGSGFEVTGSAHYMVAHAAGQRDRWAERFEDLYRSFVHYFSVRGIKLQEPPAPLLGIVCRNRAEFSRYAASQGIPPNSGVTGWYDAETNRIIVFDMGRSQQEWQETASVIIHEAAHQAAFNTGIHSRYTMPPLWVAEGLATLFEAPGVFDARNHTQQAERINRGRFDDFRLAVMPQHKPELLASLVAGDELFAANPGAAYAEAWALTFFLVETMPQQYGRYLQRTAARPPFVAYTSAERVADFTAAFGSDWRMLEARFLRFMKAQK
jgi:hypothetical protein